MATNDRVEIQITSIRDLMEQFKGSLSLEAEIMLCLTVKLDKNPNEAEQSPSTQELSLELVGTASYMTGAGKVIRFVEESGIHIPAKQHLASITFMSPKEAFSSKSQYTPRQLIRRQDQKWGEVYAPHQEVIDALQALHCTIAVMENNEIDIKKLCPEANTDIKGPVNVSVADVGSYFNRFMHRPETSLPMNYHSTRKTRKGSIPEITFISGYARSTPSNDSTSS